MWKHGGEVPEIGFEKDLLMFDPMCMFGESKTGNLQRYKHENNKVSLLTAFKVVMIVWF